MKKKKKKKKKKKNSRKFSTGFSKAVPLLQFFFVRVAVVSYVMFVLSLFVPHLSVFWCVEKAVFRDCDIS